MEQLTPAMEYVERLKDLLFSCTACLKSSSTLTLNGRRFKILKLLGEGGFSFVYLAQDEASGRLFALKKIRCPLGSESVREAMKEMEASRRFRHPNCIRCLDSAVVQEPDCKVIYLFLPFYKRGNIQDAIAEHTVNGTQFEEKEMLTLFLGTCEAVRAMHTYVPGPKATYPPSSSGSTATLVADATGSSTKAKGKGRASNNAADDGEQDGESPFDDQAAAFEHAEEEEAIRAAAGAAEPLIGSVDRANAEVDETDAQNVPGLGETNGRVMGKVPAGSIQDVSSRGGSGSGGGQKQPWAHRDIKPANVMISDDGTPILMDFGSALPARIPIPNRSVALQVADDASEKCSMPYRAPELFDPPVGSVVDEKVDVWSLGCMLYAMAYNHSPFETEGGNITMAVRSGNYRYPSKDRGYSADLRQLIDSMLVVDPKRRPDIHQAIARTQSVLQRLQ